MLQTPHIPYPDLDNEAGGEIYASVSGGQRKGGFPDPLQDS